MIQKKAAPKPPAPPKPTEFVSALRRVANTADGRIVLREIMNMCGFKAVSTVANPQTGEIYPISVIYNEARRNLWLALRGKIPIKNLNVIEAEQEKTHAPQPEETNT